MKLSRTSGYAINVMLQLAEMKPGVTVSRCQLAASGAMPERYLLEVLRDLVTHGMLHSTRGSDGGFSLARDPKDITLRQVFEIYDTPRPVLVPSTVGQSDKVQAKLLGSLQCAYDVAAAELQKTTLATLLSANSASESSRDGVIEVLLTNPNMESHQAVCSHELAISHHGLVG